ncbi:MAG TPA: DUF1345 domain-containing protein [Vicinamibacterales bacterium]|nr:DUF1345 domain-containing protein [Vicinamibacterales bacterium]
MERSRHRVKEGTRLPYIARVIRARPRLFLSLALGVVVVLLVPQDRRLATRLLLGWDLAILTYLALACQMIAQAPIGDIRRRAPTQDEGRIGILVLTTIAAMASFGAIIAELGAHPDSRQPHQLVLAIATIFLSWAFTHTIFALHYAHEYYTGTLDTGSGLTFPGNEEPDYWDFIYFSFVIGMTSQVSDVAISSKSIRRTATAHGVLSFIFNAAILALTINIVAGAI